jgi:DNA ligase-1
MWPVLYGKPSNGEKTKMWKIEIIPDGINYKIVRAYGYLNCKTTVSEKVISSGKNIGKKNETSVEQQAKQEAESLFKKQKEKGYSETIETQKVSVLPMLAHDYNKRKHDIVYPCYAQPKIDGVRMMLVKTHGKIQMISRTGKSISLPHIETQFKNVPEDIWFDGEIFTFELPFEEITGLFKTQKNPDMEKIVKLQFHIFDCYDPKNAAWKFVDRSVFLKKYNLVCTLECKSIDDVDKLHNDFISQGYEGLMLRNADSVYKPQYRSKDLQKLKNFCDSEYKIVGSHEGKGDDIGTIIFECTTESESVFSVRPRGTLERRRKMWETRDSFIGKMLTVRYQNLTEYNVPRFPVGIVVRDYD